MNPNLCSSLLHKFRGGITAPSSTASNSPTRRWYTEATLTYGWSRAMLVCQIDVDLFHRRGRARGRPLLQPGRVSFRPATWVIS